jgi:hypothetical protein
MQWAVSYLLVTVVAYECLSSDIQRLEMLPLAALFGQEFDLLSEVSL